jgi:hypothetical protein
MERRKISFMLNVEVVLPVVRIQILTASLHFLDADFNTCFHPPEDVGSH